MPNAFDPCQITTDNKERIYITDYDGHCVIMTDFQLNKIKSFGCKGDGNLQFNWFFLNFN